MNSVDDIINPCFKAGAQLHFAAGDFSLNARHLEDALGEQPPSYLHDAH